MTKAIEAAARAMADFNGDYEGPELQWQAYAEDFRVGLPAYLAAMKAEGWVLAPMEPSDGMVLAGLHMEMPVNVTGGPRAYTIRLIAETYRAMIAASTQHDDGGE